MRSGRLNTRITLQSRTVGVDAYGSPVETWIDAASTWAEYKTVTGREFWANERTSNESEISFRIRFRTDVDNDMRVVYRSESYEITGPAIDPDGRRRELILTCKRIV